jgi:phosphoribosylglycinamide formyltransferase-1
MPSIVILISGRGSNMKAIVKAAAEGRIAGRVAAVISNRPDVKGLMFAEQAGIPTACVDHRDFADRAAFDQALMAQIDRHDPAAVVLAGFMRVLSPDFVDHYAGRLVNIHPSLLPAFVGLHTHARAIEAGVKWHGCTVHFVTADLDCGPIIIQGVVPVLSDDDEARLAERVLGIEHRIYPQALDWLVRGRLLVVDGLVKVIGDESVQQSVMGSMAEVAR